MKLSMFEFKKGLGVLMIFFPGLKVPALLESVLWGELKEINKDDFMGAIRAICNKEKSLFIDNQGRPGVNLLALINQNIPVPERACPVKALTSYRSTEELKHGKFIIQKIIASLADKKTPDQSKVKNTRATLGTQIETIRNREA